MQGIPPSGIQAWRQLAPSSVAQWLSGIGTLIAVLIALFKDEWLRWRRRPKLSVTIKAESPNCLQVPTAVVFNPATGQQLWSGSMYWLRLWVENTGKGRAEQVQVFASKLYKEGANGKFAPIQNFEPMNLRWANPSDPIRPEIFAAGLSGGFGKHCDLLSVSDPANPTDAMPGYQGQCIGTLQLEVPPTANRNRLPPGKYIVEARVGAANAKPVTVLVELNIKGGWSPDPTTMFTEFLGVRVVSSVGR